MFYAVYDFERGFDSDIRSDEYLFEVVKYFIVNLLLAGNCACDFREYALLCAFKPFVKSLLFFLRKETEYTHWCKIEINRLQNYKKTFTFNAFNGC